MGEAVMSREEAVDLEVKEMEEEAEAEAEAMAMAMAESEKNEDCSTSMVRWERFLPRMVMRVLLVEADDSTRQIIAALLRKCSYRVTAVPDGLKAWEVLNKKRHNIDLILAEDELPSISGFALLTLITEHEICKKIPVIMMSSNDSVSIVYKCMLRGAADFLVKPLRKNELRNLWQHVWRRQASTRGGRGPQDASVEQQNAEATAENNGSSNRSSGYMACVLSNRECIDKGSDAQSSCMKPDMEEERGYAENLQGLLQSKSSKSPVGDMEIQKHEEWVQSNVEFPMHDCEDRGVGVAACTGANAMNRGEDKLPKSQKKHATIVIDACDNNSTLANSSEGAIDLKGAFDNYPKCGYQSSENNGTNKVDSSPLLDLSLRRSQPSGSVNQVTDVRQTLNHSDASAFSRYINRGFQSWHSPTSICNQKKDHDNSDRQLCRYTLDHNSETHGLVQSSQQNLPSLSTGQSGQAEVVFPCPQQTVFSIPLPVRGIRFDSLCTAYDSVVPTMFCTQSVQSTVQSPGLARHQEPSFQVNAFHQSSLETRNSQQFHNLTDQNAKNSTSQSDSKRGLKFESSEDRQRFSSATDQSASSSFCNGNVVQVAVVRTTEESGNKEGFPFQYRDSHQSVRREVALTKFRLKRKDRCYEKKVRYENRKKLAEQHPRVKGQFVRQMHPDPAQPNSHRGTSLHG